MIEVPKALDPRAVLNTKLTWRVAMQLLAGGLFGASISYAFLSSGIKIAPPSAPPLLVMGVVMVGFVIAFAVNVLVHEIGHALAARMAGGSVLRVVLGPWRWERVRQGYRLRKIRTIRGVSGFVQSLLPADQRFRRAMSMMVLGGPFANLLLAALGWWLLAVVEMHYAPRIMMLELTVFALMLGGINLLPFTAAGFLTDGGHLRRLWTQPQAALRYLQMIRLARASLDGKRPRDFDPRELDAMEATDLSPMDVFFIQTTRASMLSDRGDLLGARSLNADTLKNWHQLPDGFRQQSALAEALACAQIDHDPVRAREWLALAEGGLIEEFHYAAARVVIAELEGDPITREMSIAQVRQGIEDSIYLGDVAVLRDKLREWERGPADLRTTA